MKPQLVLFLTLSLLCIGAGAGLARTPDQIPPARETVCDAVTGAAFGLCNAYCEAMDCDSDSTHASERACTEIRTRFQNITGRDVPCEITCPCLSIPQFTAMLENANYCYADLPLLHALSVEPEGPNGEPPPQYSATSSLGACGYVDEVTPANTIILLATPEQVEACLRMMADATASRGLTCQLP